MAKRIAFFTYGVAAHAMFLGVYAWMAGFVGGYLPFGLPTLDGAAEGPTWAALLLNAGLIILFGVQHSVMARPAFKAWWTRYVPEPIERSTYVVIANVLMILLMLCWAPLGGVIWHTEGTWRTVMWIAFAFGWLLVPLTTLMTNHFDLFGTRQVWLYLQGKPYTPLHFGRRAAYKHVRHPLYVGWIVAFWAAPTMTVSHLLFASLLTAYILIAIPMEERDLLAAHGEHYETYKREVGGLVPRLTPRSRIARNAGAAAFLFFGLKGVAWLVVGAMGAATML